MRLFRYIILTLFSFASLSVWAKRPSVSIWQGTDVQCRHVSLLPYLPEGKIRAAVIVCPGGSYSWLSMRHEGSEVAEWLQQNGIAAFVLKYRVQGVGPYIFHSRLWKRGHQYPDMLEDLQRAIQLLREQAVNYGISDVPLGTMGFSAGGHLAMLGAELSSTNFLASHDITPQVSLCPDFVVSVYPVVTLDGPYCHARSCRGLLGEKWKKRTMMRDSLSLQCHVPKSCPPVFLVNCKDDPVVKYQNAEMLDSALTAQGVKHRFIQYDKGGHGFGVSPKKGSAECRQWKDLFLTWLSSLIKS